MSELFPFTPEELGMPSKFKHYRHQQEQAFGQYLESETKVVGVAMPPGGGKSLFAVSLSTLTGKRECILTSTNELSKQYMEDFESTGLVQIKGRSNYKCVEHAGLQCDQGVKRRCSAGFNGECPYRNQYEKALKAERVITNYDYFVAINLYGEGLGHFGIIVMDEAHDAPMKICSAASIEFTPADVYRTLDFRWPKPEYITSMSAWDSWAKVARDLSIKRVAKYEQVIGNRGKAVLAGHELEDYENLLNLQLRLDAFIEKKGDWATQPNKNGHYFEPLWPKEYVYDYILRYGDRVVMQSATLTKKSYMLMGVADADITFREYPSVFLTSHSYLYHIPTLAVSMRSTRDDLKVWHARIDQIIRYERGDLKGIIHSQSHERARDIIAASEFKSWMVTNSERDGLSITQALEEFRGAPAPKLLVTPSVTTGYDFPGKFCEYQIIPKMFIPNTSEPIMRMRADLDDDFTDYIAAQTLVQACGRPNRYEDDFCENWLIDNIGWVKIWSKKWLYPEYFKRMCKKVTSVQPPKRKLK